MPLSMAVPGTPARVNCVRGKDEVRRFLENLGFVVTAEQNHYKFTYFGDSRYMTVFAKTPSDKRAGKNSASDAARMAF